MPSWLMSLFHDYGYGIIAAAVLLENAGVPAPGHAVMLAGGALAQQEQLEIIWVIVIGALAAVTGDNIGYWIGRRGGRPLLERYGRRLRLSEDRLSAVDAFFVRHGAKTVFIGRFVTGLQTVVALVAGASRMPWRQFALFNAAGALAWACAYGLAGYFFGASWALLERWFGRAGLFLAAVAVVGLLLAFVLRRRRRIHAALVAHLPTALISRGAGVALAVVTAAGLFAKIGEDVVAHESTAFDRAVSLAIHSTDSLFMDVTMRAFTVAASFPVAVILVLALTVLCWRRGDRRAALALLGVASVNELTNFLLKEGFARPRPTLFQEIATLHSYSFPSGHSMAAVAVYGMMAIVLARLHPTWSRPLAVITPLFVLLVGLSRIFLGVHWATDVLGGFAAGAVVLLGGVYWLARADRP